MTPEEVLRFLQSGLEHPIHSREELLDFALKVVENEVQEVSWTTADFLGRVEWNRKVRAYYVEKDRRKENREASKRRGNEARQARALRDPQILSARQAGETVQAIGERFGLSRKAVRRAVERTERKIRRCLPYRRAYLAQLIDPGGPRDVWLTFVPGPDPRFDFMQPSDGS
jgi:hypothetical protein